MKTFTTLIILSLTLLLALNTFAAEIPQVVLGHDSVFHGGNAEFSKSGLDTIFLIGPHGTDNQVNGQFQDINGNPAWNGWTHKDLTQITESFWHISDYNADNLPGGDGNLAAYCGDETIAACDETDVIGGYGNNWHEIIRFNYTVADPQADCSMVVSGVFNNHTEPGYDYTHFQFQTAGGPVIAHSADGVVSAESFSHELIYHPADYVGPGQNRVTFEIVFKSDTYASDADCEYFGNGACQVDDLTVTCSNGDYSSTTDFEDGWGDWELGYPNSVGDFSQLWVGLEDIDPCFTNTSPQVAFINDGTQVPGVVGSPCIDWCYGPGGYIVNTTGGASERPNPYLHNAIESPPVTWPDNEFLGCELTFGIYRHEELAEDSPGMFYSWSVRSAVDPENIEQAPWKDRGYVYYGGPDYYRGRELVTDLLVPGVTTVQVQLTCYEQGWAHGYTGDNGYPAPYLDNVRLTSFLSIGPGMSTRAIDLAQDNFPAIGLIDMNNLAANNVRFDNALNKASETEEHNIPGDSITCDVSSVRSGGVLIENRLNYTMLRNPVFDSVRDPAWAATGYVAARPAVNAFGNPVEGTFAYDLPDSGFLFPGDILHYYFSATDEVAHANPQSATLPADLTGYGDFSNPRSWNTGFQVHALPSVDAEGIQPSILFWNDFASRGGEDEWFGALDNLGLAMGVDYDVYYTNGPSSGVGNGLGGRATDDLMDGYTDLLYTAGDLSAFTLSNGDFKSDPSADIQLLSNYVAQNSVNLFLCGDGLATDLNQSGGLTSTFLNNAMNVIWDRKDVRGMIGGQTTPLVIPVTGNSVFYTSPSWIAYGGCNRINTFDGVLAGDGAERLARFTTSSGAPSYTYSAATLNLTNDDKIITMPYDFMYIYTNHNDNLGNGLATRTNVLEEVLGFFGYDGTGWNPTHTPSVKKFVVTNYPNPFNPATKIEFNLPQAGHLTLKIFNVRGELVKILIDESRAAGSDHIMWDGSNDQGGQVSSGVYFYEARAGGEVKVSKMALIK